MFPSKLLYLLDIKNSVEWYLPTYIVEWYLPTYMTLKPL
jgi:hypothetical protein